VVANPASRDRIAGRGGPGQAWHGKASVKSTVNIVLIGPPGSGKGTQAARICEHYDLPAISTGEILRAAVRAESALGRQVQAVLSSGGLVGDDLMIDLVGNRLAEDDAAGGFVLDGFPRTIAQARALDGILAGRPVAALLLDVPMEELERRLTTRRICSTCKALYSSGTSYGSEEELCSRCGGTLIRRDDDNVDVIRTRLATYRETTEPVVAYYREHEVLSTVDGSAGTDAVTKALLTTIDRAIRTRARATGR